MTWGKKTNRINGKALERRLALYGVNSDFVLIVGVNATSEILSLLSLVRSIASKHQTRSRFLAPGE